MMDKKNIKVLVFDPDWSGHHLEYLQHIYGGFAKNHIPSIFIVAHEFKVRKAFGNFSESVEIEFRYMTPESIQKISNSSPLINNLKRTRLLKKYIREFNPEYVLLITLMPYFPFICFVKSKVIGILYNLHTRTVKSWKLNPFYLVYCMLAKSRNINRVFILNDRVTSRMLSIHFKTTKFQFLPDPFPDFPIDQIEDFRDKYSVPQNGFMFCHIGSMTSDKGTLDILAAIRKMNYHTIKNTTFVFAGIVYESIIAEFEKEVKTCRKENGANILVFNQFCTYSFLASVVKASNYILIPYKYVGQSSGIVSYSMKYSIPLIGPAAGLLGHLIFSNNLGFTLKEVSPDSLAQLIDNITINKVKYTIKEISNKMGTEVFSKEILSILI